MSDLSHLTDQELADFTAMQERVRDTGEPDASACAEEKLGHLYAELEIRAAPNVVKIRRTE